MIIKETKDGCEIYKNGKLKYQIKKNENNVEIIVTQNKKKIIEKRNKKIIEILKTRSLDDAAYLLPQYLKKDSITEINENKVKNEIIKILEDYARKTWEEGEKYMRKKVENPEKTLKNLEKIVKKIEKYANKKQKFYNITETIENNSKIYTKIIK